MAKDQLNIQKNRVLLPKHNTIRMNSCETKEALEKEQIRLIDIRSDEDRNSKGLIDGALCVLLTALYVQLAATAT